jgi:hypothetical protein
MQHFDTQHNDIQNNDIQQNETQHNNNEHNNKNVMLSHRHQCNVDCLKARAACLVCFISTVNGHHKKKRKRSLERLALVVGT